MSQLQLGKTIKKIYYKKKKKMLIRIDKNYQCDRKPRCFIHHDETIYACMNVDHCAAVLSQLMNESIRKSSITNAKTPGKSVSFEKKLINAKIGLRFSDKKARNLGWWPAI